MPIFEIVCLANSRKRQGRCVAGLRVDGKGWLRPVGSNAEGVLYPHHYMLPDDTEPQLGDVLRVHCSRPKPQPYHPEDWAVMSLPWERVTNGLESNKYEWLRPYLAPGPNLLGSSGERIALKQIQAYPVARSLSLIAPQNIKWHIALNKEGERRTRVVFTLDRAHYSLPLTDPVWEQRLLRLKAGLHERETAQIDAEAEVWLTVSLGEPFAPSEQEEEFCYKLVAGVLVLTPTAGLLQEKTQSGEGGKRNKSVVRPRKGKIETPTPAYSGASDLAAYPDPFAEDMPAVAVTVTEGRPNVTAIILPVEMLPPLTVAPSASLETAAVPISPSGAPPTVARTPAPLHNSKFKAQRNLHSGGEENGVPEDEAEQLPKKNKTGKRRNREADTKAADKENERTNGKWDNKQDQLLWQRQIARMRHTVAFSPSEDWSPDEDALLLRLAADGETSGDIAFQIGRSLEVTQARLETLAYPARS